MGLLPEYFGRRAGDLSRLVVGAGRLANDLGICLKYLGRPQQRTGRGRFDRGRFWKRPRSFVRKTESFPGGTTPNGSGGRRSGSRGGLGADERGAEAAELEGELVVLADEAFHQTDGVGGELVELRAQVLLVLHRVGGGFFRGLAEFPGVLDEGSGSGELVDAAGGVESLGGQLRGVGCEGIGDFADVTVFQRVVQVGHGVGFEWFDVFVSRPEAAGNPGTDHLRI